VSATEPTWPQSVGDTHISLAGAVTITANQRLDFLMSCSACPNTAIANATNTTALAAAATTSFIIKMPLMHRLACFRDDIIFFVYLYQKWIYRTDYNRVNGEECYSPTRIRTLYCFKCK
jgi:hypothetical protein